MPEWPVVCPYCDEEIDSHDSYADSKEMLRDHISRKHAPKKQLVTSQDTMFKVWAALRNEGLSDIKVLDCVNGMQNFGIIFVDKNLN